MNAARSSDEASSVTNVRAALAAHNWPDAPLAQLRLLEGTCGALSRALHASAVDEWLASADGLAELKRARRRYANVLIVQGPNALSELRPAEARLMQSR